MAINKDNSVKHNKRKYLKTYNFFKKNIPFVLKKNQPKKIRKIIKDKELFKFQIPLNSEVKSVPN